MIKSVPNPVSNSPKSTSSVFNRKRFRSFQEVVRERGFTVRKMCSELRIAAESLRAAYDEPGRLSLNAALALSEMLEEDPQDVLASLVAEIKQKKASGAPVTSAKRSRSSKKPAE